MAWPLVGGNGVTPHPMLPSGTEEERNPHPASIQELRLCVQQAQGWQWKQSPIHLEELLGLTPTEALCSENVAGLCKGTFREQSQMLLELDLKLSRTGFFTSPSL